MRVSHPGPPRGKGPYPLGDFCVIASKSAATAVCTGYSSPDHPVGMACLLGNWVTDCRATDWITADLYQACLIFHSAISHSGIE